MNRYQWFVVALVVLALLLAYALPTAASRPPVLMTPTPTPAQAVSVLVYEASGAKSLPVGATADIRISFEPSLYSAQGNSVSYRPWGSHDVTEMQACVSPDAPCDPGDAWVPFAPESAFSIPVDWIGPRQVWVTARFRNSRGWTVPAFAPSGVEPPGPTAQVAVEIWGVADEATPIGAQPPAVQTAVAATQTAFPVQGSVEIEGGRSATGGTAGETIQLDVAFVATSPHGPVTEMRVVASGGNCRTPEDMAAVAWEPFVPAKTYEQRLAINWIGWYVTVQYRDAQGNLSPVYCDDIALEGHPPAPTQPPAPAPVSAPCAFASSAILLPGLLALLTTLLRRG